MRLTHRMIEVFRVLVQTGNATRTAEMLCTSQPSISRDLARLEQVTGIALFERRAGRLYPTAQALALYHEVQRSFIGLGSIAARAERLRALGEGQIRIAALPCLCETVLPAACALFHTAYPNISIQIEAMESPDLETALMNQQVDLGLVEHLDALPEVVSEKLFEGDEVVLIPTGHALARKRKLAPADFRDQPFISFDPLDMYRKQIDAVFHDHQIQRKTIIEVSSANAVCALVGHGVGLAIVNPFSARQAKAQGVTVRPFSESIPYRVGLARPKRRPAAPVVEQFVLRLQRAVRNV